MLSGSSSMRRVALLLLAVTLLLVAGASAEAGTRVRVIEKGDSFRHARGVRVIEAETVGRAELIRLGIGSPKVCWIFNRRPIDARCVLVQHKRTRVLRAVRRSVRVTLRRP
jgi:hypothetical protein